MLKFAKSVIDSFLGKKRRLDEVDEDDHSNDDQHDSGIDAKKPKVNLVHRVKVFHLPEREVGPVRKYFQKLGYNRVKKAPQWNFCYITVDSEEEARKCLEVVKSCVFKKKQLTAEYVVESEQSHRERFQRQENKKKGKKDNDTPQGDENDTRTPAEKLADQVTPLWREPYEVQLKKKNRKGLQQLMSLKKDIARLRDVRQEYQRAWAFDKGALPCEVLDPIGSPLLEGYRTKCEFTIGKNLDGEPSVGFLLGLYRNGITTVLEPDQTLNVPETAKKIAKAMNDYVKRSDLPVYDRVEKTGCWRTVMCKTQSTGDVLVLIQLRDTDISKERLAEEKQNLVRFWQEESGIPITTLVFQVWNDVFNGVTDRAPLENLIGDGYIYENLLGCRFRLSALSFFQVNTAATELLYAKCAEWCNIDPTKKTTLLDLCCGTGTIGITMAKSVDRVVGIELIPEAIVDAKENAKLNNLENVTYYAAKVEDKIDVVRGERNEDVVAVLDPPRNGVHANVIRAIREAEHINRVVYISCDAEQAYNNFLGLCRPESNRFKGLPFKPNRAVSIDLFPHTKHCELMIEFVRIHPEEAGKTNESAEQSTTTKTEEQSTTTE
ncbi:S-adenosyl-L-methionine-dependent methyltransferase [Mycotypha africana]|uniref:S-adenosyl-L-methionine-dependent methyltransferase n=1 Tax=Mycotypha africana TaxID=64632 RepID=UPI002300ACFB|nr:S-adenosyl-L-methionine-dependent methyltransferase [Mycotypha africana]KAI8991517.1 S-adenosyl-L-methionine-dependent methyltransferase [Mycotypha africana]